MLCGCASTLYSGHSSILFIQQFNIDHIQQFNYDSLQYLNYTTVIQNRQKVVSIFNINEILTKNMCTKNGQMMDPLCMTTISITYCNTCHPSSANNPPNTTPLHT